MRILSILAVLALTTVSLAGCFAADPAGDEAAPEREIPEPHEPPNDPVTPMQVFERFDQRPAGVERDMRFLFGPFLIPPGQDLNRLTLDLPVHGGFLTAVSPNLYDATTGETPSNQHMHIHHAHWFRVSDDPDDEYYTLNLAWVFGSGEERTQGSLHDRANADPDGPRYGIYIEPGQPQALIYMLHNKMAEATLTYVALDVRFVYGSPEAIASASSCPGQQSGENCQANQQFHHLHGTLWGTTFDVPRQPIEEGGTGIYLHPVDIPEDDPTRRATDHLGRYFVAGHDGTAIAAAGHLHPSGIASIVVNLGPEGSGCEADLDGDGYPGITLFRSDKIEWLPDAWPYSEEYQMGATKDGWRAPIRAGDRIAQFSPYANDQYASYEAMSFVGLYVDRQQVPEPRGSQGCTVENTGPTLLPGDPWGGDPTETVINRGWKTHHAEHCGIPGWPDCHRSPDLLPSGLPADVVHIAAFLYAPGDRALSGDMGNPPQVQRGDTVYFVNEDAVLGIRHTVTSCEWPCNGPYVANYPLPDGLFDSGRLGNLDPIDGGLIDQSGNGPILGYGIADETSPVWGLETSDLDPGQYAYYCRIHPWMRGTLEVV